VSSAPVGIAKALFDAINFERTRNGLHVLPWSSSLASVASRHSSLMAAANKLAHQLGGEPDPQARAQSAGFTRGMAENVAENGNGTTAGALQVHAMMYGEKPPNALHRSNILSASARVLGVGVVIDAKGHVWLTEDFGF
jgi:uncharacterized protein YkwD